MVSALPNSKEWVPYQKESVSNQKEGKSGHTKTTNGLNN